MTTARNSILAAILGLTVTGVAAADEAPAPAAAAPVAATKTSSMPDLISKSYGSILVRHSTADKVSPAGDSNIVPSIIAIPTLGTKLFDEKLDLAASWAFKKTASSLRLNKVETYLEASYSVIDNDHVTFYPYAYFEQANGNSFSWVDVGPHVDVKASPIQLPVGKLALSAFVEPLAEFASGHGATAEKSPVRDRTTTHSGDATLLTEGQAAPAPAEKEIEMRDAAIYSTSEVAARLAVDAVKGLSFGTGVDLLQSWVPKYDAKTVDNDTRYSLAGYATKSAVMNKVSVSYKLSDSVTVSNQVRYMVNGLYAERYDSSKLVGGVSANIENRLTLTATLF